MTLPHPPPSVAFDGKVELNFITMKRISKQAKAIADAHIEARKSGNFNDPVCTTKEEVIAALRDGKTIEAVLDQIEIKFTSIHAIILSRVLFHQSKNYRAGVYKGFRLLLD
jgi:hypothetical protein